MITPNRSKGRLLEDWSGLLWALFCLFIYFPGSYLTTLVCSFLIYLRSKKPDDDSTNSEQAKPSFSSVYTRTKSIFIPGLVFQLGLGFILLSTHEGYNGLGLSIFATLYSLAEYCLGTLGLVKMITSRGNDVINLLISILMSTALSLGLTWLFLYGDKYLKALNSMYNNLLYFLNYQL